MVFIPLRCLAHRLGWCPRSNVARGEAGGSHRSARAKDMLQVLRGGPEPGGLLFGHGAKGEYGCSSGRLGGRAV
eukprot:scaffold91673_cov32-Tisochrysis_lutea.AAC.1